MGVSSGHRPRHVLAIVVLLLLSVPSQIGAEESIYLDVDQTIEARVNDLVPRLTLAEKVRLISADSGAGTSLDTAFIERLRIPRFSMTDGPHGASFAKHFGAGATAFPTGITLASTWNRDLIEAVGRAIAMEAYAQGRNVILGPCVNIHRTPFGGRNFESFSEDPHLAAEMAVAYIQGVQSQPVVACVKHFACNNQEWHRTTLDARVPKRALREIYLPAFRAAVREGQTGMVMAAYNRVNGSYASENRELLQDLLKDEWGFRGAVISDWGAVHSTVPSALAGLDLEMGGTTYFAQPLADAVEAGVLDESLVDDKVRRLLRVMMSAGIFDEPWAPRRDSKELYQRREPTGEFAKSMYDLPTRFDQDPLDSPSHRALALQAAREGMVLLKNEGSLLPLDKTRIRSIAVIGPNGAWENKGGGGSSEVQSTYTISPLEALLKKVGDHTRVEYALGSTFDRRYYIPRIPSEQLSPPDSEGADSEGADSEGTVTGLQAEYFDNPNLEGDPVVTRIDEQVFFHWGGNPPAEGLPANDWSVRWRGKLTAPKSGDYRLYLFHHGAFYANEQGDGVRLYVDGELAIDHWQSESCRVPAVTVPLNADEPIDIQLEYHDAGQHKQAIMILGWLPRLQDPIAAAARLAARSDVAVLCLGDNQYYGGENNDRGDLRLPGDQEALIKAVVAANPNTIVALYNGSPWLMESWIDHVPALIECWYPNQEGGTALADILFGDTNPSGKLPVTIAKRRDHYPDHENYPGDGQVVDYEEGVFVGYRHLDREGIEPRFAFGFGMSYTTFAYSQLQLHQVESGPGIRATCRVSNTGPRFGKEVVQMYLADLESTVERPPLELKGFVKVSLQPGESEEISFTLDAEDLSFYDEASDGWRLEAGEFEVLIGASSRDIRLRKRFTVAN